MMEIIEQSIKGKNETVPNIVDEESYYKKCIEYALSTGWIQPQETGLLKKKYLEPIYKEYQAIARDIQDEIASDDDPWIMIGEVVEKMNAILERTERIGSTDPENITRSIWDFYKFACKDNHYSDYAAMALGQAIGKILYS